jgi:hypothetical protein
MQSWLSSSKRESKICQYVGSAGTPSYWSFVDELFISCVHISDIRYTNVYVQFGD